MKTINLKNYGVIVLNSDLTREAIVKLEKHNPKALALFNENGDMTFRITFRENAEISEYGVCFNKVDSEGKALMVINEALTNEEIADKYASILMRLKETEIQAETAYATLVGQLMDIANSIEEA